MTLSILGGGGGEGGASSFALSFGFGWSDVDKIGTMKQLDPGNKPVTAFFQIFSSHQRAL